MGAAVSFCCGAPKNPNAAQRESRPLLKSPPQPVSEYIQHDAHTSFTAKSVDKIPM